MGKLIEQYKKELQKAEYEKEEWKKKYQILKTYLAGRIQQIEKMMVNLERALKGEPNDNNT